MVVSFEQRKVPRNRDDVLAAVGRCPCGFELYGSTIGGVKQALQTMETCPLCHEPLFESPLITMDELDEIAERAIDKMRTARDDWEMKGFQR